MDHRLGFNPRIFVRRFHSRGRLVGVCRIISQGAWNHHPIRLHFRALQSCDPARCGMEHLAAVHRRLGQQRCRTECPGHVDRRVYHVFARPRHQGIRDVQQRHRGNKISGDFDVYCRWDCLHQPEQLASVHTAVTRPR